LTGATTGKEASSMKSGLIGLLLCTSVLTLGLPSGREARGEDISCIGSCRIDYGSCLMGSQGDTPADQERRAECGRAYVKCAAKCRAR
jgi:hypothetical protein